MDMIKGSPAEPAGATLPIRSIKVCVVYDATSGQIHHQHKVLTLEGGAEPSEADMERDALARLTARRSGHPGGTLAVLHVAHDALEQGMRYRVDVTKKVLVAE
jgi:hypothetical protein